MPSNDFHILFRVICSCIRKSSAVCVYSYSCSQIIFDMNPYDSFRSIVYQKLRFIALILGEDILAEDFHVHILTVAEIVYMIFTVPVLLTWSVLYGDRNFALKALGFAVVGLQVISIFILHAIWCRILTFSFLLRGAGCYLRRISTVRPWKYQQESKISDKCVREEVQGRWKLADICEFHEIIEHMPEAVANQLCDLPVIVHIIADNCLYF